MPVSLRVATFNVRHCEGLDGAVDVERVASVIRGIDADVIALQELDRGLPRSGGADQPALLEAATGLHVAFAPTLHRRSGDYGIGLAARRPIGPRFDPLPRAGDEEPRGTLRLHYGGLEIVATHLTRDRAARPLQLGALARLAEECGPRVVVMGDLNVQPRDLGPLGAAGLARCERLPTLPAHRPRRQIDHVLVGAAVALERCWTIPTDASDHRPLVAELVYESE